MELIGPIFVVTILMSFASGQGFDRTVAAGVTGTPVYSPGYEYGLNYGPNTTYTYFISTSYPGHNVSLTVVDCQMESDKNGDCLYDKLEIYDGPNSSAPLLAEFCCADSSRPTWISSTNEVSMTFFSDATNEYLGFNITATSFGPTTTTSTTSTTTTATTSTTTSTTSTTTSTSTTATTPTTTSTTVAPTTTAAPAPTAASSSNTGGSGGGSNSNLYIIIGCSIGGLLLIIIVIIAICYFMKKSNRAVTPSSDHKRILWSRQTTSVKPFEGAEGPPGSVTQTNIFDMSLPGGRANLLPPLDSQLEPSANPVVIPGTEKVPEVTS